MKGKDALEQLEHHFQAIQPLCLQDLFINDAHRFDKFSLEAPFIFLDYSKNRITDQTLPLLIQYAEAMQLSIKIEEMFEGARINSTENRAVLHTALRDMKRDELILNQQNVMPDIHHSLKKMEMFVNAVHKGEWLGYTGKPITDCVNIGIGGSDLGPRMVTFALQHYATDKVHCHFVSNVDASKIAEVLKPLNPETTLFIIASKTFTTTETMTNANTARQWLLNRLQEPQAIAKHFVAISTNIEKVKAFGIAQENIFEFWNWVGGRYSLWSAIGLSIALSIGMDHFKALLDGAYQMDQHFRSADFDKNMPVIMALLSLWYRNFFHTASHAIIPYCHYLQLFPAYLQQLFMESNGKSRQVDGSAVNLQTGEVIWGGVGTDGQHAYHQLLHQGTDWIPVDFIVPIQSLHPINNHHQQLYANCLGQSQALLQGKSETEALKELQQAGYDEVEAKKLAKHKVMPGNRPSNTILVQKLTPQSLGSLIALYEHIVFVQGVLWNINSFDQWGVELGKTLTKQIISHFDIPATQNDLDSSTQGLIQIFNDQNDLTS